MTKDEARQKFIKDWSKTIAAQCGVDIDKTNPVAYAYITLAVSQCMDAAIQYASKLDAKVDDGYKLG